MATAVGMDTITLHWAEDASPPAGAAITHYVIESSPDGNSPWTVEKDKAQRADNPPSFTDDGLAAGTTMYYRVAAVNAGGRGDWGV